MNKPCVSIYSKGILWGKDTAIAPMPILDITEDSSKPMGNPSSPEVANQPETKSLLLRTLSEYIKKRVEAERKSAKR